MRRPSLRPITALLGIVVACAHAPVHIVAPPTVLQSDAPPMEPGWSLVAPLGVPLPIVDVGALTGGEAVIVTHAGMYRWDGVGLARVVCDPMTIEPTMIDAEGDGFIALGGDPATAVAYVSADRGASCEQVALPPLLVPRTPAGRLGVSLHEHTALAWSTSGAIARSDDGGRTWRRLPNLPEVLHVEAGPHGTTISAAHADTSLLVDSSSRVVLYRNAAGAMRWEALTSQSVQMPLVLDPQLDGSVQIVDGLGAMTLTAEGTVGSRTEDPGRGAALDRPRVLQRVAPGRVIGFTDRLLVAIEDGQMRPFAALPGLRSPHIIAAALDGPIWVSDGERLWRTAIDAPVQELTRPPFERADPVAMTVRGDTLVVATHDGALHVSDDSGRHWARRVLPHEASVVLAMTIDPHGTLLALGPSGLAVSEGERETFLSIPELVIRQENTPTIATLGDRWIVAAGTVSTSDDQGAHWTRRLGSSEMDHRAESVVSLVMRGEGGVALEANGTLLRTDDGAISFHAVGRLDPQFVATRGGSCSVAWDGDRNLAVGGPAGIARSFDGGAHFAPASPRCPQGVATLLHDGRVALTCLDEEALSACGTRDPNFVLMFLNAAQELSLPPGACSHRGKVFALDGSRLYVIDAWGTLWRASLDTLARENP